MPWTGTYKAQAEDGTLKPALQTATWNGQLVAVPDNTNTQLLWYRSDLVPNPPTTWAQMIADAEQLAKEGKPHYIEIQGAQYEGATVWFNTMVASAGGSVLNASATGPSLGAPAVKALSIMKQLADSPAADPSLSVQMENQNRLAMEAGTAAFELNYPFVYPSMKMDNPKLFKNFKWAPYPAVTAGRARQGDDRRHRPGGQRLLPAQGPGLPGGPVPARHAEPAHRRPPSAACRRRSPACTTTRRCSPTTRSTPTSCPRSQNASVRPQTPFYQVVSIDISHQISPPSGINPAATEQSMVGQINNALASKGLVP